MKELEMFYKENRNKLVKAKNDDLRADSHNILNRSKN
jgi:hypothetical protein